MGTGLSRPLPYSCYEVAHTWTPHCSTGALQVGLSCSWQALRIYSSVYMMAELVKGRVPDRKRLLQLILGILQSTTFLSYNAFGFVWGHCFVRRLLGFCNFWTVALLPGWLCSFLAIWVERAGRRAALATYVTNIAASSLVTVAVNHGWVRPRPYCDVLLATLSSSLLLWLGKQGCRDPAITALGTLVGSDELQSSQPATTSQTPAPAPAPAPSPAPAPAPAPSPATSLLTARHHSCPHPGSCLSALLQSCLRPLALGVLGQGALSLLSLARGRGSQGRARLLGLPLALASYGLLARSSLCLLRWLREADLPSSGLLAGALAGLAALAYRSTPIACYTFWKALEVLLGHLTSSGVLPSLPMATELVYASSTAVLFQMATLEPHSLSPSYWQFLERITGARMSKVNRLLVDHEYGTQAARAVQHRPLYRQECISAELSRLLPAVGSLAQP